jgi:hypothetical protein
MLPAVYALVVVLMLSALALAGVERGRALAWRRARARRLRAAMENPDERKRVLDELLAELERVTARGPSWWGTRSQSAQAAELRLGRAMLLNADDRPDEALVVLTAIDPNRVSALQQTLLGMYAIEAHLRLAQWDAAERVLDGYALDSLNPAGRALRSNARAQIRLGRGDARGALRVLDDAGDPPDEVRAELMLTRARALGLDGRDQAAVRRLLDALDRRLLERLVARHPSEPAARAARQLLDEKLRDR